MRISIDPFALGLLKLATVMLIAVFVWGKLLPAIGQTEAVKQWIEPLRVQGINPAGMYYTDVFDD
jgi:hypothetical protein